MSKPILGNDPFSPPSSSPSGPSSGPPSGQAKQAPPHRPKTAGKKTPTKIKVAPPVPIEAEPLPESIVGAKASYGPPINAAPHPERREILAEVHQLERRICERTSTNLEDRRRVPFALVWKIWRRLAMRARSDSVDDFGRDLRISQQLAPVLDFLYRRYFRVEAEGLAHIPDQGRALLVSNHSGTIPYDGAMIMHAVNSQHPARREVRPLVEDFVFHFPYLGTLVNRIGCVRACQENATRLLASEQLVVVFPEGVKGIGKLYSQRYQLQRFGRGGFIKLALSTGSPIIPTAVVGAEEIHPLLSRMTWLARPLGLPYIPITPTFPWLGPLGLIPLPTKWYILFGEPLYFNVAYGPDAANDRILVNKLAEQVRKRIQEMVDTLLKRRQSVMYG